MFLANMYPEIGADETARLATLAHWDGHYNERSYAHGSEATRKNWAELAATKDAIKSGWTSVDPALDLTIAISEYPDFLDTFHDPVVNARRSTFSGIVRDALATPAGELVATVKRVERHYGYRAIIRMGLFDGALPRVDEDASKDFDLAVVIGTSGEHLSGNAGESLPVHEDLPVHGLFMRDGVFRNRQYFTVDDMRRRSLFESDVTGKRLPIYDVLIGNEAVRTLFNQTINKYDVNEHNDLIAGMATALGVPLEAPALV